jgi:hypothetical protein
MKKLILLSICFYALTSNAQIKKEIFVGVGFPQEKLSINGGLEFTTNTKSKKAFFIRPTYTSTFYRTNTVPVKYIDVPLGLKFKLSDISQNGSTTSSLIDFSIGPYIGYAISGKYNPVGSSFTQSKMSFGNDATDQMDPIDYGIFLNTRITLGQTFGFGIASQIGLKEHDMSKLGTAASTTKEKAKKGLQITLFFNLGKRTKGL